MDLFYDEVSHVYRHGSESGPILDGVTSIIDVDTTFFTEEGRVKGTHVHEMTALYDKNDLDEESLYEGYRGYLVAYKRCLAETGMIVFENEVMVHSDIYLYAGREDKVVQLPGKPFKADLDVKSGAYSGWTELQTAAYSGTYKEPRDRYGLELRADGTYRLWPHKNRNNFQEFLTLLMAKRIREQYKLIRR